jgi:hypothetical protein
MWKKKSKIEECGTLAWHKSWIGAKSKCKWALHYLFEVQLGQGKLVWEKEAFGQKLNMARIGRQIMV